MMCQYQAYPVQSGTVVKSVISGVSDNTSRYLLQLILTIFYCIKQSFKINLFMQ